MTDEGRWYLLFLRRHEINIARIIADLRKSGIEAILIKGWAASRFYPPAKPRYFSDVDLAVFEGDFPKADEVLRHSGQTFGVDLHRELRHLDTLSWTSILERCETVQIEGVDVKILCPEDHLRVMSVHWLTDGGENQERLWDIYHVIASTRGTFDWDKCLNVISETRRKWIISVVGLTHRYLGLDISELPFADEAMKPPQWLIRSVESSWRAGIPLKPLHTCLWNSRDLLQQIQKRLPPNPVQATVDLEGRFDEASRLPYQIRDVFFRLRPSLRRVIPALIRR